MLGRFTRMDGHSPRSDKWVPRHDALNRAFDSGTILTAPRAELEQHLLTTSETRIPDGTNQGRNERRATAIRHLLQVRITERVARRTLFISIGALIVSFVAVTFTGLKFWQGRAARPSPTSPPVLSSTPSAPAPPMKGVLP